MFARVMSVVSPCVFMAFSIMWGLSDGRPVFAGLAIAVGAVSAFLAHLPWRKYSGGDVRLSHVKRQDVLAAVGSACRKHWVSPLFVVAIYFVNAVVELVLKGAHSFGAWDVLMLWFIVDVILCDSWVELLRKRADSLAGEGEA